MGELHGGQVVHDGNVDKALRIFNDADDGVQVLGPAFGAEARWRALQHD